MRKDPVAEDFDNLADGWDESTLRHGDKVARVDHSKREPAGGTSWTHANTCTLSGLLRSAFLEVG